jgi:nitroreductase
METLEAICTRTSVREYLKKPISKQDQEEILKAAMHAPSAYNEQPWQFIVIEDPELLHKIATIHPHAKMCDHSLLAILVCSDASLEKTKDFWIQDCSAATQNLLLAAHAKGIGAVWSGVYPREEIFQKFRKLFHLPEKVTPFSLVVLGYPKEKSSKESRYKKERIHYNSW